MSTLDAPPSNLVPGILNFCNSQSFSICYLRNLIQSNSQITFLIIIYINFIRTEPSVKICASEFTYGN